MQISEKLPYYPRINGIFPYFCNPNPLEGYTHKTFEHPDCFTDMDNVTESESLILKYFPSLNEVQTDQLRRLGSLYPEWNSKINVVSRTDIGFLYTRHVLHSLSIAAFLGDVAAETSFMDLGTGGGFPGIPLAIMYPQAHFHLIDRIGKKILVASEIAKEIGLTNVTFAHGDSGECHDRFDYVVSRAVMSLDKLVKACTRNITSDPVPGNRYTPGLICLKGGDLEEEIKNVHRTVIEIPVTEFFNLPFFDTKEVVYVPINIKH